MTLQRSFPKSGRRPTGPSPRVRGLVVDRTNGWCSLGCRSIGSQLHHRRPRRMGGTTDAAANRASNCLWVCYHCHRRIESRRRWALDSGLLLHADENPLLVPVLAEELADRSVWLDDTGGWSTEPPTEENEQ